MKWNFFIFSSAFLCLIASAFAQEEYNSCSSIVTSSSLSQSDIPLNINAPEVVTLKWESVASGNNLEANGSSHVSISTYSDGGKAQVRISIDSDVPTKCSAISLEASRIVWWLPIASIAYILTPLRSKTFWVLFFLVGICSSLSFSDEDCSCPLVSVRFPMAFISKVCINDQRCIAATCDLGFLSQDSNNYNKVSAANRILFSDEFCTLKKPKYWDEWVSHYFGMNITNEEFYYIDSDNDGLVNILEYYSNGIKPGVNSTRVKRSTDAAVDVTKIGSDPTDADTDDDLLLDGFETFYGLSPTKPDDSNADDDNDGISNLQEQIYGTDPLNADSDGDGTSDGTEVEKQGDPSDITDNGSQTISEVFAMVQLTIGDHSGSHSERYNLHVGGISHQSPGFGLVGKGTYKFVPGTYPITVQWVASTLLRPDYDYTAQVSKMSGKAIVKVEDPQRILGVYMDSTFDRTVGKKALLIVEAVCSNNEDDPVECYKTCIECQRSNELRWDSVKSTCRNNSGKYASASVPECPCHACEKWYREEKVNIEWLNQLNSNVPCPCQVVKSWNSVGLQSANKNSKVTWDYDYACIRDELPACSSYHPGKTFLISAVIDYER